MHIPKATYRIQFNADFNFRQTQEIIPYLNELGVDYIYASPVFKSRQGSEHGYDIVDAQQLNPELGAGDDFESLCAEIKKHNMFWLQDIVPNHMSFDRDNLILMDVLEYGKASSFFDFFDINWQHAYESIKNRVLVPFLGKFYAQALEDGEISLCYERETLSVNYYSLRLPLKILTYKIIYKHNFSELENDLGTDNSLVEELKGIFQIIEKLENDLPSNVKNSYEQLKQLKVKLWQIYQKGEKVRAFIDQNIKLFNGEKGNPGSFDRLDHLLSVQNFRLSFWKVATEEINYRRFFNINELICLRTEKKEVFDHNHRFIFELIDKNQISGLRIDHIDGLYDPQKYLNEIRLRAGKDVYVVVEKILSDKEKILGTWPVQGTTGYDFLNYLNNLFCAKKNQRKFNRIYTKFTQIKDNFEKIIYDKKRLIIEKHMTGDIDNLALYIKHISSRSRYGTDITLYGLKRALIEIIAFFNIYRTYFNATTENYPQKKYIIEAVKKAKNYRPRFFYELDFIEKFLLLDSEHSMHNLDKQTLLKFTMKFQQLTGPLMAKGVEDTAFYIYNKFLSLNEVGGMPHKFGIYINDFHNFNKKRLKFYPHSMNASSTHDTKRGEDARARLNVLSEIPAEWEQCLKQWHKINKSYKKICKPQNIPDKNDEYFLYQTLIGAFPFNGGDYDDFRKRLNAYLIKAVREAKIHTAWLRPDIEYESAYLNFVEKILDFSQNSQFLEKFLPFFKKVSYYGMINSLSQTLIKMTAPGVPDFYQGCEFWNLSMVDPDNRRAVDFIERQKALTFIKTQLTADVPGLINTLFKSREDGRIKLFLIYQILQLRSNQCMLFQKGEYIPLDTGGIFKDKIIAYARHYEGGWGLVFVPRFLTNIIKEGELPCGDVWSDTYAVLPDVKLKFWQDAITFQKIENRKKVLICDIFKYFPAAVLVNQDKT